MADPETVLAGLAAQLRPLIDELAALAPGETTFEGVTGDEATVCRVGLADGSKRWEYSRRVFFTGDFRELSLRAEQVLTTRGWTIRLDRDSAVSRIFVAQRDGAFVTVNTGPDESGAGSAAVLGGSSCVSTDGEILGR